ncbi:glycosyltransferase [Ectothiorhodospira shaposhnikovii]|uniref:glycosyltransferase n=1 Tax=Ectothiorhodospira shaposhnikovii TaxID=1054 RepID=UPI001EE7C790|nr:glycosyltransferase [Ectothiorhodospira shaposhnikovii]MCG5512087.1 glycosyltransferase [Ectothiorhodospira shaposhnikovii]
MNRQHLLSRLASRGWPIYYTTGALDLWDRHGNAWKKSHWLGKTEPIDGVSLYHAGKLIPRWRNQPRWDQLALKHHTRRLCKISMKHHDNQPIMMLFHPGFWPYVEYLTHYPIIFHAYDLYSAQPDWNEEKESFQTALLQRANLVTASSKSIAEILEKESGRNIAYLPNGADVKAFNYQNVGNCPDDLAAIPQPRIGYIGAINKKVDLRIIAGISKARPNWNWCLIGPIAHNELQSDPELFAAYKHCLNSTNVHFLGERRHDIIPSYANHMDINTMCYRCDGDGWWKNIYPLKMHEYLATGKPVVSSDVPSVREYADVIAIANDDHQWINLLQACLQNGGAGSSDQRLAVAQQNSWETRVTQLEQWLLQLSKAEYDPLR